jgi:hypothetical protein
VRGKSRAEGNAKVSFQNGIVVLMLYKPNQSCSMGIFVNAVSFFGELKGT